MSAINTIKQKIRRNTSRIFKYFIYWYSTRVSALGPYSTGLYCWHPALPASNHVISLIECAVQYPIDEDGWNDIRREGAYGDPEGPLSTRL
ncbi:hypothetical protein CPB86DRAFT_353040 [Serendipita vermifera]|nr:hypothetical protein CPB86DRAFT_353040 [Serendipita vermifera]